MNNHILFSKIRTIKLKIFAIYKAFYILDKFILKISIFNSIGCITATVVPTYLDPKLTSHIIYSKREYPFSYWVLLLSLFVFFFTYFGMIKFDRYKLYFSFIPLIFFITLILISGNFCPECLNSNVLMWSVVYTIASIITAGIHFLKFNETNYNTEYIKGMISLWSVIMIALFSGYIAIIIPWVNLYIGTISKIIPNEMEQNISARLFYIQLGAFSIYMFWGPIYEAYARIIKLLDFLIKIKNS